MTRLYIFLFILIPALSCTSEEQGPDPFTATGEASFYGRAFNGQKTASGDIYKMDSLTAAHLYLPLGTIIEVKNLDNGRVVEVVINDRGPYSNDRLLDLSRAAADSLGMVEDGTAEVRITVVKAAEGYTVEDSVATDRQKEYERNAG
ncbi:septal ring lytic transglycosylase RlpA family protein [Roseivirga sp. BDSF3-8]|uniref:septal ring lytic transglycosylase RlpA family protein n=1 Tax=Roseivirga sp. BDSF3-8 TaxID=3241598 RepID=UPI003532007B